MSVQTLDQFIARWSGQVCDFDGAFGEQCVDLADFYLRDVWAIPPFFVTGAVDLFGHRPDLIEWIANDAGNPNQYPQPGDLVIWGPSTAVGTGVLGHVDVFIQGGGSSFVGFDENWPLNAHPHAQPHNYLGVKGWGRRRRFSLEGLADAQLDAIIAGQSWDQIMVSYGEAGFARLYARAHPAPAPLPSPPPSAPPGPVPASTPPPAPPVNPPLLSPPPLQEVPPVQNPPVPPVVPPEVPEPPVVAEQGVTTSEWKLVVGYLAQGAAIGTADLANLVGQQLFHASVAIPPAALQLLVNLEFAAGIAVVGYAISRGVRKLGAR